MLYFVPPYPLRKNKTDMALKIKVMAEMVNNLSDARYFAAMGTEWIAFNAGDNDANSLTADKITAMAAWLQGVQIVVQPGNASAAEINELVEKINPDYILWPAAGGVARLEPVDKSCGLSEWYVIDLPEAAVELPKDKVLCRYTGNDLEVEEFIFRHGFAGIVLSGGHEIAPGLKSFDEVAGILEALEAE